MQARGERLKDLAGLDFFGNCAVRGWDTDVDLSVWVDSMELDLFDTGRVVFGASVLGELCGTSFDFVVRFVYVVSEQGGGLVVFCRDSMRLSDMCSCVEIKGYWLTS